MKRTYFLILVLALPFALLAQDKEAGIFRKDIKVLCVKTGNYLYPQNDLNRIYRIIERFGKPDSITSVLADAVGGFILEANYGASRFYVPDSKHASSGFYIQDADFIVVMKDSLKLRVGESVEPLRKQLDDEAPGKWCYTDKKTGIEECTCGVSFSYMVEVNGEIVLADQFVSLQYDCNSLEILNIRECVAP
jgi:hypothetical protein